MRSLLLAMLQREKREESSIQALRRSSRASHPPEQFQPGVDYIMLIECGKPSCFQEAMQMDDKLKWEQAMQSEYDFVWKLEGQRSHLHMVLGQFWSTSKGMGTLKKAPPCSPSFFLLKLLLPCFVCTYLE